MLKIIRQLHAPTLTNPHIRLQLCHLHQVQLQYFGRYTVSIRWVPAVNSEKRSSSGVVIPSAPRFRQGLYEIDLSEVPTEKGGRHVNPHRRMKYFFQDMLNREADLHSLMNVSEEAFRFFPSEEDIQRNIATIRSVPLANQVFFVIFLFYLDRL